MNLKIDYLGSGGIITNYFCSSTCRHCLYACSPRREKDYISESVLSEIIHKIKAMHCHSVHVGGGEPFLNPDKLEVVMHGLYHSNIAVEYIETNSSWFRVP